MNRDRRLLKRLVLMSVSLLAIAAGADAGADARSASSRPPGVVPESFTAVSDSDWWVLGGEGCGSGGLCRAVIAHTTDAGRSFILMPAPAARIAGSVDGHSVSGIGQIAFATADDGWAAGTGLWSTHDGGRSWSRIPTPGAVDGVVTGGGYVYAAVQIGAPGRPGSRDVLWRSIIGRDRWTPLPAAGSIAGPIAVHGDEVFVPDAVDDRGLSVLGSVDLISHDNGRHFARDPLPNPGLANEFDPTSSTTVWDLGISGGPSGTVFRSTNGGRSFVKVQPRAERLYPNSATVFAAASDSVAVLGLSSLPEHRTSSLYRTTDGGTTWTPLGLPHLTWSYLGFTDADHGVGFAAGGAARSPSLYATSDGGASFREIPIP